MNEEIFALSEEFEAALARSRWTAGWIDPWTAAHLRRRVQALCGEIDVSSEEDLAELAVRILAKLRPPPLRGRSPYANRCPLAAAMEAGNRELAEHLWQQAPRKWWRDGEALLGEARRAVRVDEWIMRLLSCWEPSASVGPWTSRRRVQADALTVDVLGHYAIQDKPAAPQKMGKRWADVLERLEPSPVLAARLAIMCATRGGDNEDWGVMALEKSRSHRGAVFVKGLFASNSPLRMPTSRPWSEEGVAELARGAKRETLLLALALSEPDAAYRKAAKNELDKQGVSGLEKRAAKAAVQVVERYEKLLLDCLRRGVDTSMAKGWRDEALGRFSQKDLGRAGRKLAKRSFWMRRGEALAAFFRGPSTAGSMPSASESLAEGLAAVAGRLPDSQALKLRRKARLAGGEFDRHFEALKARELSAELGEVCSAPLERAPVRNKLRL